MPGCDISSDLESNRKGTVYHEEVRIIQGKSTTPPQAAGVSDKGFHLKAIASVTLDSVFTGDGLAGKTWHDVSNPPLRLVASVTLDSVFTGDGFGWRKTWHDVSNPPATASSGV